jgi:hypothetical protein
MTTDSFTPTEVRSVNFASPAVPADPYCVPPNTPTAASLVRSNSFVPPLQRLKSIPIPPKPSTKEVRIASFYCFVNMFFL